MTLAKDLSEIRDQALEKIKDAPDLESLDKIRVEYLGKSGVVSLRMRDLGKAAPEERKTLGQALNQLKQDISGNVSAAQDNLEKKALEESIASEIVDITLPTRPKSKGSIHPVTHVTEEIVAILGNQGFSLAEGPDIEDDWHNFEALNFPPDHPAREMQDTFFFPKDEDGKRNVLRTHTSSVQIRWMENNKPPYRIMAIGRTYRCDSDVTHSPMFHQVEGLCIDKKTNMSHLKGCLKQFVEEFFEVNNIPMRFRPSFFPFTEPSAEVDIGCSWENGELKVGQGNDWLEIGGCGMVHPNVLKNVNLDPEEFQGFAFGMGIDRMAMLKYGIPDVRSFFEGDVRWLKHFGFSALHAPTLQGGLS